MCNIDNHLATHYSPHFQRYSFVLMHQVIISQLANFITIKFISQIIFLSLNWMIRPTNPNSFTEVQILYLLTMTKKHLAKPIGTVTNLYLTAGGDEKGEKMSPYVQSSRRRADFKLKSISYYNNQINIKNESSIWKVKSSGKMIHEIIKRRCRLNLIFAFAYK